MFKEWWVMAVEELINQALFDGIIDVIKAGVREHLLFGNRNAGPRRLEAACQSGISRLLPPSVLI